MSFGVSGVATQWLMRSALAIGLCLVAAGSFGSELPIEVHDRIAPMSAVTRSLALSLDACAGKFDEDLVAYLVRHRIPATLFVTKRWIDANPVGVAVLRQHMDLFDIEDHGEKHIPAVIGAGRLVYGIAGEPDLLHLRREVTEGALAIEHTFGVTPHWYRGATAEYDSAALQEIAALGYKVAGFSVNADEGATLSRAAIEKKLQQVQDGDVIIAHMNKPASDSAEGLAVALERLQRAGFNFVRFDQVDLVQLDQAKAYRQPHETATYLAHKPLRLMLTSAAERWATTLP